jgi:hypothetical protein
MMYNKFKLRKMAWKYKCKSSANIWIPKLKVVLCLVQFFKTYVWFAGGGIISRYIIVCFLSTILYDVILWLFDCFSLVSKLCILDTWIWV